MTKDEELIKRAKDMASDTRYDLMPAARNIMVMLAVRLEALSHSVAEYWPCHICGAVYPAEHRDICSAAWPDDPKRYWPGEARREQIARIIDPDAWLSIDYWRKNRPDSAPRQRGIAAPSLTKADAILALFDQPAPKGPLRFGVKVVESVA